MSRQNEQGPAVSVDGIVVTKSYEYEEYPVPAVELVVRSDREERTTVRIEDPLPDPVSPEDVGFHPDYGEDHAEIVDETVTFQLDIETDESATLVYGLRNVVQSDLTGPPPDPIVSADSADDSSSKTSEIVRDVIAGGSGDDGTESIEPGAPTGDGGTEEVAAESTPRSTDSDEATGGDGSSTGEIGGATDTKVDPDRQTAPDDQPADRDPPAGQDGLVEALARELRAGKAAESDLAVIRETFGGEATGSTEARLEDLQSQVADLRAYTGALEEFLDEKGPAREVLENLEADLNQLDDAVSDVNDRLADQDKRLAAQEDSLESVRPELTTLRNEIETGLDDVDVQLDELESKVDDEFDHIDERVGEVEDGLVTIPDDLADGNITDRIDRLEDRLDEIGDDLDGIIDVQERLQSVFTGESDET